MSQCHDTYDLTDRIETYTAARALVALGHALMEQRPRDITSR
jgi:hypothetical protein